MLWWWVASNSGASVLKNNGNFRPLSGLEVITVWEKKKHRSSEHPNVSYPLHMKILCGNWCPLMELLPKSNWCSSMGLKPSVLLTPRGPQMGLEGLIFHSGFCLGRCYIHPWAGSRRLNWSWDLNLGFQAGTKQQKVMITWNPSRKTTLLYASSHCRGSVTSPDLCSRPTMLPEVWRKCLVSQKWTKETTLLVNFTVIFCMPSFTFLSSQSNTTITQLELEDKCILVEGAMCIGEMLWDNSSRTGTWSGIVCSQNYCSSSSIFRKKILTKMYKFLKSRSVHIVAVCWVQNCYLH